MADATQEQWANSTANYYTKLWEKQSKELTGEQKDEIGIAYKSLIQYLKNPDNNGFWYKVAKIVPDFYSEEDLGWLISKAERAGAWYMILALNDYPNSAVLSHMIMHAVANK